MASLRRNNRSFWTRGSLAVGVAALAVSAGVGVAAARPIGPFDVGGAIEAEYDRAGGGDFFGDPTTPETDAAGGGKKQDFVNNVSIYWTAATDAHGIGGAIRDKWRGAGSESGTLKYPVTDEGQTGKPGRFQHFQGGSIYWSLGAGTHLLTGVVRDKYASVGWENSPLGFPIADEDKNGTAGTHTQLFEGGAIYSTQRGGTRIVWGAIRDTWVRNGAENGKYGYPTGDEYDYQGGKAQDFQGGKIIWKPES
ncbi:LGFP repeat-containing protein [Nocardia sp. NBC_00511]|uniref:LGFP repeat-containing protein n=1 Tax=Nocardia sp. NBC_00511 TaxID=2903591 RepID=UPI0030E4491D